MLLINKSKWLTCLLAFLIFILAGCSHQKMVNVVSFEPNNYQVYFYSDGENDDLENNYLSAILNLKISNPDLIRQMDTEKVPEIGIKQKEIEVYPTLVISKDGEVVDQLSGENKKQEILERLRKTVVSDSQYSYSVPH